MNLTVPDMVRHKLLHEGTVWRNSQVYYYAVHYGDRDKESERKILRKCYLGPETYIYVSQTHPFGLRGPIDKGRVIKYLEELSHIIDRVELEGWEKVISILLGIIKKLENSEL